MISFSDVDVTAVMGRLGIDGRHVGSRFWALCPFHQDHDPSWMIRTEGEWKGAFKCYSCGAQGDLVHLVRHVLGLGFREAKEWFRGDRVNRLPGGIKFDVSLRSKAGFSLPPEVEIGPMSDWIPAARDYAESRGITADQVRSWRLGYAVGGRLDGRLVLPTWQGIWPTSYTARTFVGDEKRYLASRTEERPDPDAMFGEEFWPPGRETVLVLEGALNVLAVERVATGLATAALGGSNPSPGKLRKLSTFREVVVLTDADQAGQKAAQVLDGSLGRHVKIRRLILDCAPDPADAEPLELKRFLEGSGIDCGRSE